MRAEGWEGRLAAYLTASKGLPFAWGQADCALWAAEWVQICTGEDHLSGWRGRYRTELGAAKLMRTRGFAGVAAIAAAALIEIPVALARRGDLVLHPSDSLGVCNGLTAHFLTEHGTAAERTLACPRAWRVG